MIVIYVDEREKKLFPDFVANFDGVNRINKSAEIVYYKRATLEHGDFHIVYFDEYTPMNELDPSEGILLEIIERKSLRDYADSFKVINGKSRDDNMFKMIRVRDEYPHCMLTYLIEGSLFSVDKGSNKISGKSTATICMKNIEASLFSKQVIHGFNVIRTSSCQNTVKALKFRCEMYSKNIGVKIFLPIADDSYEEVIENSKPSENELLDNQVKCMWKSIKGIGDKIIPYLMKHFTIHDMLTGNITFGSFDAIKEEGGRTTVTNIGIVVGFSDQDCISEQIKLLTAMKGITEKSAKELISKAKCIDIAEYCSGVDNHVGSIKNGTKNIIGKAMRVKLGLVFNYKRED